MPKGTVNEILINERFVRFIESTLACDNIKNSEDIPKNDDYHPLKYTDVYKVKSVMRTQNFIQNLRRGATIDSEILPNNCKYIRVDPDSELKLLVIEEPPKVRTVFFKMEANAFIEELKANGKYQLFDFENKFQGKDSFDLSLSFPYVIFIPVLDKENRMQTMHVFFRLHPLTNFNDYLLIPSLPNIDTGSKVCLRPDLSQYKTNKYDLSTAVNNLINDFWFNKFNRDYFDNFLRYRDNPYLCDLFSWNYHTKFNPLFIFSKDCKWINSGRTLNQIITGRFGNNLNGYENLFNNLSDSLEKRKYTDNNQTHIQTRNLVDSVYLDSIKQVLSIGEELLINEKTFYIESIIMKTDNSPYSLNLEDTEGNKLELELNQEVLENLEKNYFRKKNYTLKIGNTEIKENDLIYIKDSDSYNIVTQIIKIDDRYQIKIGRDFYLESCFLNNNIKKIENNLEFCGEEIIPGKEYHLGFYDGIFYLTSNNWKFTEYEFRDNILYIVFKKKINDEIKTFYVELNKNSKYKIINENIEECRVFRLNNNIVTGYERTPLNLVKGKGISVEAATLKYDNSPSYSYYIHYDRALCRKYFEEFMKSEEKTFVIKSFDFDLQYSIDDEAIVINWERPDEMFNIKKIIGFTLNDISFNLKLTDSNNNVTEIPLVFLDGGECNFINIRKVIREFNNYSVGLKVEPNEELQDFLPKQLFEIKAFIIDGEPEPLVLFSNYRTLYFSDFIRKFDVIDPSSKKFKKALAKPKTSIKVQTGDFFSEYGKIMVITKQPMNTSMGRAQYNYYPIAPIRSTSLTDNYRCLSVTISRLKNVQRRGILYPRYMDFQISESKLRTGHINIRSKIFKENQTNSGVFMKPENF